MSSSIINNNNSNINDWAICFDEEIEYFQAIQPN